ncbi:toprim domain-containing protein [Candidatus Nanobsidianus stetteri]|uniref:Toprim domain-containing protein n=1 Tax=Nanobsidianus stetteri TaxID=1294122 RepID=A0A2T9WKR8_NANST|nr:toprim domain-containing protein [Candidatus Nanobsidianus stetteri]MCC5447106.1 toprim domain-containing protein [Candidatus Nanobsidianus stetteri]
MYKIISFLHRLREKKDSLIVVEGKRDKEVLREFGFNNVYTIYELRKDESVFLNYREAIILTDNDNKGRILYKYVRNLLESDGIIINDIERRRFFKYFKVREVEDLRKRIDEIKFYINYFENPEKILYF